MKISELKQPYRRMAEYLAKNNTSDDYDGGDYLINSFRWITNGNMFWNKVDNGEYPPITEEIKTYFPDDFDFSGEEQPFQLPDNPIIQNRIYTQLAKEGRFDELPDTCEFSEPVELEVWDIPFESNLVSVFGKFHGKFIEKNDRYIQKYAFWNFAQLPTKKIDFTVFKTGDVVEVEYYGDEGDENIVGYIYYKDDHSTHISSKMTCYGDEEIILNQNIRKITKIK